jgi:hypothetical protein
MVFDLVIRKDFPREMYLVNPKDWSWELRYLLGYQMANRWDRNFR